MGDSQGKQWGMTKPISEQPPNEADLKLNDKLIAYLKDTNNFESPKGMDNRYACDSAVPLSPADSLRSKVLQHIQKVAEEFMRRVARAKKLPEAVVNSLGGRVFTFGSYQLGVYGPSEYYPITNGSATNIAPSF
jgi:poly(A) polymerase